MDSDSIIAHYQHRLAEARQNWYDEQERYEQRIKDLETEIEDLKLRLTEHR